MGEDAGGHGGELSARRVGWAFETESLEGVFRVCERVGILECGTVGGEAAFVFGDEGFDWFPKAIERIDVFHHTVGAVEDGEVIAK